MSDYHLTVTNAFGPYARGAHIEDAAEVARILGGDHYIYVVKVIADQKVEEPAQPAPIEPQKAPIVPFPSHLGH
jgi:hypothetical protein